MKIVKSFKKFFKDDIIRRVFVKNTFDGVITVLGILVALYLADVMNNNIIIASCFGSGIAIGVSGIWGAYITEKAERELRIKELEKQLLRSLDGTKLSKWSKKSSLIVALFDGVSPLIAVVLMITPFLFTDLIGASTAYFTSFLISALIITFLGIMISKVSKEKVFKNVIKMLFAGVTLTIILYVIELIKEIIIK